jgi:hypothetical protein
MLLPRGSQAERGGSDRKGKERAMTNVQYTLGSLQAQIDETLQRFANGLSWVTPSPGPALTFRARPRLRGRHVPRA